MFKFLQTLIIEAGSICIQEQAGLDSSHVEYKNAKDLVTKVDRKVEAYIIDRISQRFPDHGIFGEETGKRNQAAQYQWIIDPIDGTTSYIQHHPFYCVSIALYKDNHPFCAGVYAPALNELFVASDKGAFLNDRKIEVSRTQDMINAVMATGFACLRANLEPNNLAYFNKIVPEIRDVRRFGSAALDLCYVACGRLDGFWEMNLNQYDIAAGAFIVRKAGGIVKDFNGTDQYPQDGIVAANPLIYPDFSVFFKQTSCRNEKLLSQPQGRA